MPSRLSSRGSKRMDMRGRSGKAEVSADTGECPWPACARWPGTVVRRSGLIGVLGQNRVLLHHRQSGSVNLLGGDIGGAEDVIEVLAGHGGEMCAIFGRHTQYHGIGG